MHGKAYIYHRISSSICNGENNEAIEAELNKSKYSLSHNWWIKHALNSCTLIYTYKVGVLMDRQVYLAHGVIPSYAITLTLYSKHTFRSISIYWNRWPKTIFMW